ncbi:AAA family ATPase [Bacillus safensis]|uniref:AAA family ATPase n=1 Tax=Bacillus safensis TaxID=561879 RepID=A0AC61YSD6_BACIA
MKLKKVSIQNYRRFIETSLSLADDVTLLAGANNSGKTSLIEFLENILNSSKTEFCVSDIPVTLSKEWVDQAYSIFINHFEKNDDREKTIQAIVNDLFCLDATAGKEKLLILPTVVQLRVDYETNEEIGDFADYIMDLDLNHCSIYFEYSFEVTSTTFSQSLDKDFEKLKSRYEKLSGEKDQNTKLGFFKEKILGTYVSSIIEKCYFADRQFQNKNEMELSHFRKLFNLYNIYAGRPLEDQNVGHSKSISKNVLDLAHHDDAWKAFLGALPDKILQPIEELGITDIVRKVSVDGLTETISSIAQANGGNTGSIMLDLEISEETISSLIRQITHAKYDLQGHYLNETSQGLGYSNMIFILLQLERYKRNIDPLLVNIFIIEEPESHMHPQMQNVFGKFLKKYYQEKKIQGLITTHSSEMVRVTEMKNLRVARPTTPFISNIFDFSSFKESVSQDPVLDNFYDWFYEIGFSDIVFADRVIIYEGDTERMLIRKLFSLDDFAVLNQLYIAFVQVGGAYAHNYRTLIEFMGIKTLILTDLDYNKASKTESHIRDSGTTNATINNFYEITHPETKPTVADLYEWKKNEGNILFKGCAYLNYQGEKDSFARTLEEAMLAKHYKLTAVEEKSREDWIHLRNVDKLKFTIPQEEGQYTIRDIVEHTSKGKTDFMYSVILNNLTKNMLPDYIEEGLAWLKK